MRPTERRLHLLRHAKSSWADTHVADHDRLLSGRGQRACAFLAAHFATEHIAPDLVLASPARRVTETIEGIASALRPNTPIWTDERIYAADTDDLLDVIAEAPPEARSLLLVGHNPAIENLAAQLLDDRSSHGATALLHKYPTGALASFDVDGAWEGIARGGTRLVGFIRPRDLPAA